MTSTQHAVIDGCRIAYQDEGSGPTIAFLHGLGTNKSSWDAQAEAFKSAWRVIRPDLRGFGESDKPVAASAYSVQRYADDVIALLDTLQAWPAVIVGTSMGGYVALAIALKERSRVAKLVLCHTACSRRVPPDVMAERLAALRSGTMRDYAKVAVKHAVSRFASDDLRRRVVDMLGANDQAAFIQIFSGTTLDFNFCAQLPSLSLPALIISSEEDQVVPYTRSVELHHGMPNAPLKTIPGAGHVSYMEKPAEFNRVLRDFLAPKSSGA